MAATDKHGTELSALNGIVKLIGDPTEGVIATETTLQDVDLRVTNIETYTNTLWQGVGKKSTTLADDGDLRTIDTESEAISLDPTANTTGASNVGYTQNFMLRWLLKLIQPLTSWNNSGAAKTVGITTIVKKTGAEIGVDGAAYASGDLIGDQSPIALAAARISGGSGILHSVTIKDLTKQNSALKIVIFDSNPSGTTFTDNSALDVADADIDKIISWIDIAASDYISFSDNSVAHIRGLSIPFLASGSSNLYFCVISNGTPTYVADELSISFGILQD